MFFGGTAFGEAPFGADRLYVVTLIYFDFVPTVYFIHPRTVAVTYF
jgi:hypothetical protein